MQYLCSFVYFGFWSQTHTHTHTLFWGRDRPSGLSSKLARASLGTRNTNTNTREAAQKNTVVAAARGGVLGGFEPRAVLPTDRALVEPRSRILLPGLIKPGREVVEGIDLSNIPGGDGRDIRRLCRR